MQKLIGAIRKVSDEIRKAEREINRAEDKLESKKITPEQKKEFTRTITAIFFFDSEIVRVNSFFCSGVIFLLSSLSSALLISRFGFSDLIGNFANRADELFASLVQ